MELHEFITRTLVDIKKGVENANKELAGKMPYYNMGFTKVDPKKNTIDFEVAVNASEKKEHGVGAKLILQVVSLGAKGKEAIVHEHINKIKFSVSVSSAIG